MVRSSIALNEYAMYVQMKKDIVSILFFFGEDDLTFCWIPVDL